MKVFIPLLPLIAINTTAGTASEMDALTNAAAYVNNMELRGKMVYTEFLAGMAFNNASLGYVHAIAHKYGGFYNLPYGVCNAILLTAVKEFNAKVAAACIVAIRKLYVDVNIPKRICRAWS